MRVSLQPAYVIHSRPYRDSSALLDVFTAEYGRLSLVARGARRQSRKGGAVALLQPFTPLLLSFAGRADLKTLVAVEAAQRQVALRGEQMFSGMYLNELLIRLLHHNDAHPTLFAAYDQALKALVATSEVDTVLRRFEFVLLEQLGYSVDPGVEATSGLPVQASRWYRFEPGVGLLACETLGGNPRTEFAGSDLLAIASGNLAGSARTAAKRLLRAALAVHLGEKSLRSRELFRPLGASPEPADGRTEDTPATGVRS